MSLPYQAPRVSELGSFAELTLADKPKVFGLPSDGFSFEGRSLHTVS